MNLQPVINQLREERSIVDQAIALLQHIESGGRKPNAVTVASQAIGATQRIVAGLADGQPRKRGPKFLSPEARARISRAMKRRWRERRKAG